MYNYGRGGYRRPYKPVAARRREADAESRRRVKQGEPLDPVVAIGRDIATTFWGRSWCQNLERYSDYANRLPRGRTYVRNGSVIHLAVEGGLISALVSGSAIYKVGIRIAPLPAASWTAVRRDCTGEIASLVDLLQGRLSRAVMERVCRAKTGLFPAPAEIELSCSCPDWATMCKHVAAVMYGVGVRLDERPELLFTLRQLDPAELVLDAGRGMTSLATDPGGNRVLADDDLGALFDLELEPSPAPAAPAAGAKLEPKAKAKAEPAAKARASSKAKPVAKAEPVPVATPDPERARHEANIAMIEARAASFRALVAAGRANARTTRALAQLEAWLLHARSAGWHASTP